MAAKYRHLMEQTGCPLIPNTSSRKSQKGPGCTGTCHMPHLAAPNTSPPCPGASLLPSPQWGSSCPTEPQKKPGPALLHYPISSWHLLFPKQKKDVLLEGCCIEQCSHSNWWLLYHIITATSPPGRFLKLTLSGRMLQGNSRVRKNHSNKYVNFACVFSHLLSHQCEEAKILFI